MEGAPPSLSYNISLNFSSIFAMLPGSHFLSSLRKPPAASVVEELATENSLDADTSSVPAGIDEYASLPGPWAFFASGYMLGLLLMVSQTQPFSWFDLS